MDHNDYIDVSVFSRIAQEINPEKELEALYKAIIETSRDVLDAETASLLLYNREGKNLFFKSTTNSSMKNMLGITIPENSGLAWNVFRSRKSMIINDVSIDERFYHGIDLDTGFTTRNILCTPMMARNEFVGVLEIANKTGNGIFTSLDLKLIEIIAMISASTITARLLYEDLKKRVEELNALYDLSTSVAFAESDRDFYQKGLSILAESLQVERASLILYSPERKRLEVAAVHGSSIPVGAVVPDDSIAAHVFRTGRTVNVSNVIKDLPEFITKNKGYKSTAFVSTPVMYKNRITGVFNLTDKKNRRLFDEFELNVLTALISHFAGLYRNFSDRRREEIRRKLRQELAIAADIQKKNLARIPACFNGINISVLYEPAKHVGGDFYDFYKIDESSCGIIIADVSGKGIPAALFTGMVKNILKFGSRISAVPADLFRRANSDIYDESEFGMFVTVFYTLIDTSNNTIRFSSAGHNDQLLLHKKTMETVKLQARGKPFGIIAQSTFSEETISYEKGDLLFLFTDGLVESFGGEYLDIDTGFNNLADIITENSEKSPEKILNILRNRIRELNPDKDLPDDLTVIAVSLY